MNSLRSLMAFTMTGKPNFASRKNTTPNESTIQKSNPGSGVSRFMFCYFNATRRHTTMANNDTPSMKAAVRIMDVRMLLDADG